MAKIVRSLERNFYIKEKVPSTINLSSKLAESEKVLIVDKDDNPIGSATRREMVRKIGVN
jgi:hypothetical protein